MYTYIYVHDGRTLVHCGAPPHNERQRCEPTPTLLSVLHMCASPGLGGGELLIPTTYLLLGDPFAGESLTNVVYV